MSATASVSQNDPSLFDADLYMPDAFERSQSVLRTILAAHFHANWRSWNIVTLVRQRIATGQRDSIVCDICVLGTDSPVERVVRTAPMICIDILSDEPLSAVQNRADQYIRAGAKHVWLIDAASRNAWRATSSGLFVVRDDQLMIAGTSVGFRLSAVFQEFDEMMNPPRRLSVSAAIERSRIRQA